MSDLVFGKLAFRQNVAAPSDCFLSGGYQSDGNLCIVDVDVFKNYDPVRMRTLVRWMTI